MAVLLQDEYSFARLNVDAAFVVMEGLKLS